MVTPQIAVSAVADCRRHRLGANALPDRAQKLLARAADDAANKNYGLRLEEVHEIVTR